MPVNKYYFTYGSDSPNQPFRGGYSIVHASSRDGAIEQHDKKYGFIKNTNTSRYACCYTEDEFNKYFPDGINCGASLQEMLIW